MPQGNAKLPARAQPWECYAPQPPFLPPVLASTPYTVPRTVWTAYTGTGRHHVLLPSGDTVHASAMITRARSRKLPCFFAQQSPPERGALRRVRSQPPALQDTSRSLKRPRRASVHHVVIGHPGVSSADPLTLPSKGCKAAWSLLMKKVVLELVYDYDDDDYFYYYYISSASISSG